MTTIFGFFKKPFFRKYANYLIVALLMVFFAAMSFTGSIKMGTQFLLEQIAIAALLAVSLGMVVGFLGELSLGHAGFMCAGAYVGGKIASVMTTAMGTGESNLVILLVALLAGGMLQLCHPWRCLVAQQKLCWLGVWSAWHNSLRHQRGSLYRFGATQESPERGFPWYFQCRGQEFNH